LKIERALPVTVRATRADMARSRRPQSAGLTHHVINRGNNRCDIFRAEKDYSFFLYSLRDAAKRCLLEIHAYTLMTNHLHFIATPRGESALSKVMQLLGASYARYFNGKYCRTGSLFEGRFKSMVIDSESYWFTCMRYVEMNPVRAGLVSNPGDYRWSSYRANALGLEDAVIVPHSLYLALGQSVEKRQQSWREICREAISSEELFELRHSIRRGTLPSKHLAASCPEGRLGPSRGPDLQA
jgi:putative transposase